MLVYLVAIVVALLIVPLTGGRFRQLGRIELRRVWLLFAGLGLQVLLELVDLPRARYDDVGLAILLASYVFIIGFGLSNLMLTGMGVITVGFALNAFVIALNQGMPTRVPDGEKVETTVKHRPEQSDDILPVLGDTIVLGDPVNASISFGDLIIAVGLIDLTYRASRRRRTRQGYSLEHDGSDADAGSGSGPGIVTEIDLTAAHLDVEEAAPPGLQPAGHLGGGPRNALERVEDPRVVDVAGS